MHEGLVEHILLELTSSLASFTSKSPKEKASAKEIILLLTRTAGESFVGVNTAPMTIYALLEKFVTRTNKLKRYGRDMSKLVLDTNPRTLVEMCLNSPIEKANKTK